MPTWLGLIVTKQELLQVSWVVTKSHYALCCHPETLLLLALQAVILAAFLPISYKPSPGKPQAFGDEVPSKYRWHPTVHLLQDLQVASINSQHTVLCGSTQNLTVQSSSHWDTKETTFRKSMRVTTALPLRKHQRLLVSAIHFICCLPLGPCPRDLAGISSQHSLATEGDLRELCWGKESSRPHRYFLYQIHPFRMNQWTSYLLQENKLDPLSRMSGCEHYPCRNLPGHSGHLPVFSFPFSMPGNWVLPRKLLAICRKAGVGYLGS